MYECYVWGGEIFDATVYVFTTFSATHSLNSTGFGENSYVIIIVLYKINRFYLSKI